MVHVDLENKNKNPRSSVNVTRYIGEGLAECVQITLLPNATTWKVFMQIQQHRKFCTNISSEHGKQEKNPKTKQHKWNDVLSE